MDLATTNESIEELENQVNIESFDDIIINVITSITQNKLNVDESSITKYLIKNLEPHDVTEEFIKDRLVILTSKGKIEKVKSDGRKNYYYVTGYMNNTYETKLKSKNPTSMMTPPTNQYQNNNDGKELSSLQNQISILNKELTDLKSFVMKNDLFKQSQLKIRTFKNSKIRKFEASDYHSN